ncbi:MAG: DUF1501 domain-containing protein [Proteobacteria bacterium]|nr:DUF1501 domain-containing protein [Pseudomonadota bacterium]
MTRRHALGLLGASALLPLVRVRRALASEESDRRFVFILCYGGWDPMYVFASSEEHAHLHHPQESWLDAGATLPHVTSPMRPATSQFLDTWGHLGCIVNGLEVPSITHEQCRKLILTGSRDGRVDDWGAILGGNSVGFDLPSVVVCGPAYGSKYTSSQLRLGPEGQLAHLVSGEALQQMDLPSDGLTEASTDDVQAWLAARRAAYTDSAGHGTAAFTDSLARAQTQIERLQSLPDDVDLAVEGDGWVYVWQKAEPALELMQRGLTRAASIVHLGEWNANWDTHSSIESQSGHFEFLANDLGSIFQSMEDRGLWETTTVVVLSEMGRAPQLNALGGKDHWTFTSAMLFGAGIEGGQVVGGFDENWIGTPVDGRILSTKDLGATLLSLGGLDPAEHLPTGTPITQVMSA